MIKGRRKMSLTYINQGFDPDIAGGDDEITIENRKRERKYSLPVITRRGSGAPSLHPVDVLPSYPVFLL